MLVYGAFHPPLRPLVLTVAGLSKGCFIALLLMFGPMRGPARVALVSDVIQVALFAVYLMALRQRQTPAER